jgi:hypothetical protein
MQRQVVIEVSGGVAWVSKAPPGVHVEIVDHDVAAKRTDIETKAKTAPTAKRSSGAMESRPKEKRRRRRFRWVISAFCLGIIIGIQLASWGHLLR